MTTEFSITIFPDRDSLTDETHALTIRYLDSQNLPRAYPDHCTCMSSTRTSINAIWSSNIISRISNYDETGLL